MRLFVAVWPPPEVVDTLAALDRPSVPGVRWTTAEQWHVTLRFLADVDDELVPALHEALAAGLDGAPAPAVTCGPATKRFDRSVLLVPVAGLDDVAAAVLGATEPLVPVTHPRPFRGHLTLARAKRRSTIPTSLGGVPIAGSWRADRVALVRSRLHPDGARYEDVASVPLEGA